jgi:hypothetical protein
MRTYHPFISEDVPASPPHAPGAAYRVSFGIEYWGEEPQEVAKVQMVYNGVVSGRRSPSYPSGTDDFVGVVEALKRLEQRAQRLPMTAERFRAFRPDSPAAEKMRREKTARHMDNIMTKLRKSKTA